MKMEMRISSVVASQAALVQVTTVTSRHSELDPERGQGAARVPAVLGPGIIWGPGRSPPLSLSTPAGGLCGSRCPASARPPSPVLCLSFRDLHCRGARNLLDKDMFSKSDPLCVMYTQGMENKQWREFGRTEVIDNTLNPDFVRKFIVDYFFEEKQNLRFDLYDVDSKSPDLSKHDFLGQAFCTLGEIVGSSGSRLEKPLTIGAFSLNSRTGKPMPAVSSGGIPGKKCGTIILAAEELSNCRDVATMQFCANKLDKKDFFGKSDPFLVFYRSNEDGTFTICHKTEVVKSTLNPVWQTFSTPVRALCNGDYDRTIKVEVYDWDRDGSHDFIGEFTTSYRELARGQSQFNIYEVINPKKKMKKKKYMNSGTANTVGSQDSSTLAAYGKPRTQSRCDGSSSDPMCVSTRPFPCLENGADESPPLLPHGVVVTLLSFAVESECTFLDYIKGGTQINFTVAIDFTASNGNPSQSTSLHYMSPYQLNAYALALTAVGEIIQHYDSDKMFPALGFGAKLPPDGRVSHEFPLNGNQEDPSCCGIDGILDAYHRSLRTVQLYGPTNFAPVVTHFVPFRDYVDRTGNHVLSMARLARDVLAEIPDQLVSYMKAQGIRPRPPPAAPTHSPPRSPARTPPASPLHL
ncbi:Copine-5 [Fukomys damarensis]|uniref:Copine-5 n=1 Tax=Fukomys damarensis TaxID=885580 RepID=A0A091D4E2_FUKDA|nr:Copine-5 [Fukomys damarensis]